MGMFRGAPGSREGYFRDMSEAKGTLQRMLRSGLADVAEELASLTGGRVLFVPEFLDQVASRLAEHVDAAGGVCFYDAEHRNVYEGTQSTCTFCGKTRDDHEFLPCCVFLDE